MKENKTFEIKTSSYEETVDLGLKFGKTLEKGDVVCLTGDLGTGKTAFTNGLARALGIKEHITSPTFTIVNEYQARLPLYHFDVYRISDPEEMFEIGFDEYMEGDGVTVIEWADLIRDLLPPEFIWVDIGKDKDSPENRRIIQIKFKGKKFDDRMIEL
ncbi:MAG: tRNA (adenosine(37)-N6)-threonylcarbamoyltransferase complex ATPase subunit type 1 TsaE [Clostridia bacterium]|nr:tRNA (adenosine(37)-N6)-threonylcarbamoyltransferase complex ATPase subunit type 1 TsaE [Clostridia bacterium]